EVIQRVVTPPQALAFLGSTALVFRPGPASVLLAESALSPRLLELVRRAENVALEALLREAEDEPMLPCVLYALGVLSVLQPTPQVRERSPRSARPGPARVPDAIDDDAVRAKVQARRALVDDGDYFAVLGVPRAATGYDIRRSYVELRRQFDPSLVLRVGTLDLRDDIDTILEVIDEAYEILRDQQRRERYRRAIESSP
ncbi:MAG TPA: DnaJ domain-containing protein, partial [Polyangiaceae bacterium]|nr:DnaJ domain-containing protein [Polyangiaceae bacterium]